MIKKNNEMRMEMESEGTGFALKSRERPFFHTKNKKSTGIIGIKELNYMQNTPVQTCAHRHTERERGGEKVPPHTYTHRVEVHTL